MKWVITVLLVAFVFPVSGLQAEENDILRSGIIRGRILNGTFNDKIPAVRIVNITSYHGATISDTAETRTDERGRFIFQGLEIDPNLVYIARTAYNNIEYFSNPVVLRTDEPEKEMELVLYEESDDGSSLAVENYHVIVRPGERGIHVQEILAVRNTAPYTFKGKDGLTMTFTLPEDARNIKIEPGFEGMNITVGDDKIFMHEPVYPKAQQLIWTYDIAVQKSSYTMTRILDYNTESIDVFLGIPGAQLSSEQLQPRESFTADGVQYSHLSGSDLGSVTPLTIRIKNLPRVGINLFRAGILTATAFFSTIIVLFIYAFSRKDPYEEKNEQLVQKRSVLIKEVAELDNSYSTGSIEESDYRAQREVKMKRLLDISTQLRNQSRHL